MFDMDWMETMLRGGRFWFALPGGLGGVGRDAGSASAALSTIN